LPQAGRNRRRRLEPNWRLALEFCCRQLEFSAVKVK
jgi:hypothetical protein